MTAVGRRRRRCCRAVRGLHRSARECRIPSRAQHCLRGEVRGCGCLRLFVRRLVGGLLLRLHGRDRVRHQHLRHERVQQHRRRVEPAEISHGE